MKAWGTALDPTGKSGIRFLGDVHGAFTKELDLSFDSTSVFGNERSKRYALVVEDGKVKSAHVEPDNTGVKGNDSLSILRIVNADRPTIESAAEKVLPNI